MIRRTDIDFKVSAVANAERVVTMTMTLTNNSPNDYYISRSAILLDGFKGKTFSVEGPSKIICPFHTGFYPKSELIEFRNTHSLSNSVEISKPCQFQWAVPGIYTVFIRNSMCLYVENKTESNPEEYVWLTENSSFLIGETRDTTVSESLSHADSL